MKKSLLFLSALLITTLTSCHASTNIYNEKYEYSLLMPVGAPVLPMYMEILLEENVETTSTPTTIPPEFSNENYDFLVFDSTQVANILKQQENPLYEFKLMLTGGNFHLLGFDKEAGSTPTEGENIYSFQKGGTANKMFTNIYGDIIPEENYFDSIGNLQTELLKIDSSFQINGEKIDWAVVSEPQLTNLMNKWNDSNIDVSKIIDINLQTAFKNNNYEIYKYDYVPQAALFVNKKFEQENEEVVEHVLERINNAVNDVINNPQNVSSTILEKYPDPNIQSSIFGFNSTLIQQVQKDGRNGFGIVPSDINEEMDETVINQFLSIVNQNINSKIN